MEHLIPNQPLNSLEKLRSFEYYLCNEVSTDKEVAKKQSSMMYELLNNYIRENDYSSILRHIKTDKGLIYIFDWNPQTLTIKKCEGLLKRFNSRTQKYLDIIEVLIEQLSKIEMPTLTQLELVKYFTQLKGWRKISLKEYKQLFVEDMWDELKKNKRKGNETKKETKYSTIEFDVDYYDGAW